jgi:hypothetical protein
LRYRRYFIATNWVDKQSNLQIIIAFIAAIGCFTAEPLDMSQAMVSHRLAAMKCRPGTRLLHRPPLHFALEKKGQPKLPCSADATEEEGS